MGEVIAITCVAAVLGYAAAGLFLNSSSALVKIIDRLWLERWAVTELLTEDEHQRLQEMLEREPEAWRKFRAGPGTWRRRRLRLMVEPWLEGMVPASVHAKMGELIEQAPGQAARLIEDDEALRRWIFDEVARAADERNR